MKKDKQEIDAYIYGHKIGSMVEHEGVIYFEFETSFKDLGLNISPIKLDIDSTNGLYTNSENTRLYKGMPGVFFDSLPDKFGMAFIERYFESKKIASHEVSLLHKLAFIGDRGIGAIEYEPKEHESKNYFDDEIQSAQTLRADMRKILEDKNSDDVSITHLMNIIDSASPVGGGRPKMLIMYNESTQQARFNITKLPSGYKRAIIKFDEVYDYGGSIGLTRWEFLFMKLANKSGIDTAKVYLHHEESGNHLVVYRFDRDERDEKIHVRSFASLMHLDIEVPKVTSYENLLRFTYAVTNSKEQVLELFKRMIFNFVAINFDDHAKNFSLMMDKKGVWRLTPAYDISYSKGAVREHLTTLNGKSLNITYKDLQYVAKSMSIKESELKQMVKDVINVFDGFKTKAHKMNLDEEDIQKYWADISSQIELIKWD